MTERIVYSRFLVVFCTYTQPGEWVTASALSRRILPMHSSEFAKEVSRKLSNLNRFGHLERRITGNRFEHEYSRPPEKPIVLPAELRPRFAFGTLILPDPTVDL